MIEAGEDPKFIGRRLVILASEDVGLADHKALGIALDAFRAVEVIGLPEGAYALTHATVYLASAAKSNSLTDAIGAAREVVENTPGADVPLHLRSAATAGQRSMGHGQGYDYPHDDKLGVVAQQYLPDAADGATLFHPGEHGEESDLAERLARIDRILGKSR
jgi:putative ATPase